MVVYEGAAASQTLRKGKEVAAILLQANTASLTARLLTIYNRILMVSSVAIHRTAFLIER